ncbi:MAG: M23 family metallopeptidase [Deltaproteobacteria bacterium]|nr:M23 family metallopeptidase [Deltaproteobacteria bacterium]
MRVSPEDWPPEPNSPTSIDSTRFARALTLLCGWMPPGRARLYTEKIVQAAEEFKEDPFLIGGLIYRESRCRPTKEELGGLGLTLLPFTMYRGSFQRRTYRYRVLNENHRWEERSLALNRFPFIPRTLLQAEPNIYFAAALLSAWRDQDATVDAIFEQVPHRHYVSHWVWGDRVRSHRAEDRILGDRRRLLQYYGALAPAAPIRVDGIFFGSPLDGAPRVVSSAMGSERPGGRIHRGIDIESEFGEPVRAIADGRVVFAGVDLPGNRHNERLSLDEINSYNRRDLGLGGRYLCISHSREDAEPLVSCYMHLETVEVEYGSQVALGQRIGSVGRTGMLRSSPHLHLEIHERDQLLDPQQLLAGHLIGQPQDKPAMKRRRRASGLAR